MRLRDDLRGGAGKAIVARGREPLHRRAHERADRETGLAAGEAL